MTDRVAEKMSQASSTATMSPPKKGERYRCQTCGMEVQVTADCRCNDPAIVHFHCCGKELRKV